MMTLLPGNEGEEWMRIKLLGKKDEGGNQI